MEAQKMSVADIPDWTDPLGHVPPEHTAAVAVRWHAAGHTGPWAIAADDEQRRHWRDNPGHVAAEARLSRRDGRWHVVSVKPSLL